MIENITKSLFATTPEDTLYHYTSFTGLLGIVKSRMLRASDIRYMNDSAELRHSLDLLQTIVTERINEGTDNPRLLNQLLEWLSHRIVSGSMLFGGSFRANGNLLSQWRGYSMHGKGVSLGFDPAHIRSCAERQRFQVGKCLYEAGQQRALIAQIVDAVEIAVRQTEENEKPDLRPRDKEYYGIFERVEGDLLRIASLLKHPSFEEEQEWRIVSPLITDFSDASVHFREGTSMLVPFYEFQLTDGDERCLKLDHVYLGPTSNIELSMNSLELYLAKQHASPQHGISYCQIPYRQR
jgi:hypothetical protein